VVRSARPSKERRPRTTPSTHFSDLAKEVQPPGKGILSRTLFNDDRLKVVIFGFAQSEELSEHTASMPAILHFLQGDATLTLGDETLNAKTGTWVQLLTWQQRSPSRHGGPQDPRKPEEID
jgi:quercetin dioxygenase-like cupin family protein